MCVDPVTAIGIGVSVAQSAVGFAASSAEYSSRADAWRQNIASSLAAGSDDQKKILLRMSQEQDALVQKRHQSEVEGAAAKAQAEVQAAQGGVGGLSLDNILSGIDRDVSRNQGAAQTNYENTAVQLTSELEATNARIKNNINAVQAPTAPSALGYALQGIGGSLRYLSSDSKVGSR